MTIVQEKYIIPDDIATGMTTGLYRRIGGVVRYATGPNKGQIVKLLQPAELNIAEQATGLGTKVLQFMQHHKTGIVVVTAIVVVGGAVIWAYSEIRNHEPKVLPEFRVTLKTYIDAIRNGSMDTSKIDALINSLEALKKHKDYEKISVQLTAEELEVLVSRIYEYTVKLAQDNSVKLSNEELNSSGSAIINLQTCLKAQKRIFEAAA